MAPHYSLGLSSSLAAVLQHAGVWQQIDPLVLANVPTLNADAIVNKHMQGVEHKRIRPLENHCLFACRSKRHDVGL
jgi:hypothetical protein